MCRLHQTAANLKICNINLPRADYNECIRDAIEFFITSPHDNKTSVNIPIFDPFTVNSVSLNLNFNLQQFRGGELRVKNLKNHGFSKLKVSKVKANFTDETLDLLAKFVLPKIHLSALYKTSFSLSGAKVDAKGQFNTTAKEVMIKASLKGKVKEVDGENYMHVDKFKIDIYDIKDMRISVNGLFREPELSEFNMRVKLIFSKIKNKTSNSSKQINLLTISSTLIGDRCVELSSIVSVHNGK